MSFRLWTIFYVFADCAAAMADVRAWGITAALVVLGFWAYCWEVGYPEVSDSVAIVAIVIFALYCGLLLPACTSPCGIAAISA